MSRLPVARPSLAALLVVAFVAGLASPAAAARTTSSASTYQIEPGDTLSGLALRFRTTVRDLTSLNGLANPHRIIAGRTLMVPTSASAGTASMSASAGTASTEAPSGSSSSTASTSAGRPGARHVVTSGDTLGGVAARYGIRRDDLARWNGILGDRIYRTTSLVLYDPGPLPAGPIVCPVPGATFFNDWAFPRPGGRVHVGTDLFAPRGTPVRAPVSGSVVTAHGPVGGLHVWLTDANGNRWMGSHLDAFGATGSVSAGDVIGYVGDTGNARGARPHLHLEYHPVGREPVNLFPALRGAC
jgi:murein DD-endopeptidase MepM/ murein hydrolase activator NlpD